MATKGMTDAELVVMRSLQVKRRMSAKPYHVLAPGLLEDIDRLLDEVDRLRLQWRLQGPIPREYQDPKEYD